MGEQPDLINHWIEAYQLNQHYAQLPEQGEARGVFARMVFFALDRAEEAGYPTEAADAVRFNLRALLIKDLPPDADPLWNPDLLGSEVLAALPLDHAEAESWLADWPTRSATDILALRRCKNLIGSVRPVADMITERDVALRLAAWLSLWPRLP